MNPNFDELLDKKWTELQKRYSGTKLAHVGEAVRRLRENLESLASRHTELVEISRKLAPFQEGTNISLKRLQQDFVNKTEAFHQHVYSTISVLILVVNYTKVRGAKSDHPIKSVHKFLDFVLSIPDYSGLDERISILKKSVDYRDKFVDHPQQHKLYDWMTHGREGKTHVIYFIPDPTVPHVAGSSIYDPEDPSFHPPIATCDFFVPPSADSVRDALYELIKAIL